MSQQWIQTDSILATDIYSGDLCFQGTEVAKWLLMELPAHPVSRSNTWTSLLILP